jgi:PPR repeat
LRAKCVLYCVSDFFNTLSTFFIQMSFASRGFEFTDEADPDFDFKDVVSAILEKCKLGHWKAATRKLKTLRRHHASLETPVPKEVYLATLQACMANRLQGARASEPARKILEDMADDGLVIPTDVANYCVQNCLGGGPQGTHDKCGGIDTALAMAAAVQASVDGKEKLTAETLGKMATILATEGEVEEALSLLRSMVVDRSLTPPLQIFADIAAAAIKVDCEKVMNVLVFSKAAGYELDNIASTVDGRTMLAAGVIAAEKMDNLALGLRLLAAAEKAAGCAPDKGDALVASSSSAAQRACTLIHKRAISKACMDSEWKLAVKLLEMMINRSLSPSSNVWKNVVTCCAKAGKSKRAVSLLLDWVRIHLYHAC